MNEDKSKLIKMGFARKAVEKQVGKFFSITRSNIVKDFSFYVIMIVGGWAVLCCAIMAGWNWFMVEVTNAHPIDFVGAMGGSIIMMLLFLFLFGLGEVK